jgi:hypothetical protein
MDNRLSIIFRFRASPKTPDATLLRYLKNQEATPISNEMALKALRAFWLPDAYRSSGEKKGQELKRLAQKMIWSLEEQANYLRIVFGIERQPPSAPLVQALAPMPEVAQEQDQDGDVWESVQRLDTGGL